MFFAKMHNYPLSSKVQHRNGYVKIKIAEGKWESEHRLMAEQMGDARGKKGPLAEGEKVFHLDGLPNTNSPDNIIRIQYNTVRFKLLKESRVLYVPKFDAKASVDRVLREVWNGIERRNKQTKFRHKDRRVKESVAAA